MSRFLAFKPHLAFLFGGEIRGVQSSHLLGTTFRWSLSTDTTVEQTTAHKIVTSAVLGPPGQAQIGQAKLGQDDGLMAALAWLGVLKSQSQAMKLWLFGGLQP